MKFVLCFVIPCGWNRTSSISVSEMLLNQYVAFLNGRKVVQVGKSQDQDCVSMMKRTWQTVAVPRNSCFWLLAAFFRVESRRLFLTVSHH